MFTLTDSVERLRANCLATDCLIIGNQQGDLLALVNAVEPHLADAPATVDKAVCRDIVKGVRGAPAGVELYHETHQLLAVIEAYDMLVPPPTPEADPATPEAAAPAEAGPTPPEVAP